MDMNSSSARRDPTLTCWEAKTIALGGVATGSMKAYEQDIVAGIINRSGCCSMETAITESHGIRELRFNESREESTYQREWAEAYLQWPSSK